MKLRTPEARADKFSPNPSGTDTPVHFLTESAKVPRGSATLAIEVAPKASNVNADTPRAKYDNLKPKPSGISTPFHFFNESANTPSGSAISDIENDPIIDSVFRKPPRANSPRAPPIAARPCFISSQDISPNLLNAFAKSPNP